MAAGAVFLAVVTALVWHFQREENPAKQLAFKATRVDLVGRMQGALARSSEAEKSAVLAITDEGSQTYADQTRAATAEVEQARQELLRLLEAGGTRLEKDLLAQFSQAFGDLQRIDDDVLRLAVKNTNLKAYAMAYGPAADALAELDAALGRLIARTGDAKEARRVLLLAFGARTAALRIQALLPPHIAEELDARMDQLEASMLREETQARRDLDGLAALPGLQGDADLALARSRFARYGGFKAQILALSRENTNVRSLALSLNQKRKAMLLCLDVLNALNAAILEEPIPGVTYGRPPNPRR
jgi:hypothetical protein